MVADNDLALGRLVERVSKSKYWEHTLILVTEDDAQAGLDRVDGHRTMSGDWAACEARGGGLANYNHLGLVRTIQEIFGVPSRTRFAKSARPMGTIFTTKADLTPYQHVEPKVDLMEMNPPLKALNGPALKAAKQSDGDGFCG
jgi:arylsulfatase A-like enzyme